MVHWRLHGEFFYFSPEVVPFMVRHSERAKKSYAFAARLNQQRGEAL